MQHSNSAIAAVYGTADAERINLTTRCTGNVPGRGAPSR